MKKFLMATLAAAGLSLNLPANATDYELRLAHFWPAQSSVGKVISDWSNSIAKESDGRIKISIFPSQTLAKAPASYQATVMGVADIVVTAQGYTAGRFPLTQVIELPGLVKTAENASCMLQRIYDAKLLDKEYEDTTPLFFFAHGPGHIHSNKKQIEKPEDLNGMRLRRATTVVADILKQMKAQPVGMPAPETYTAAQREVIDGVAFPWQAMKDFRLNELLTHHTEVGLYTLSFITTMNKAKFAALPDDLKQVMVHHSGEKWARIMGKALDDLDTKGRAEAVTAGHTIKVIDNVMESPTWGPLLKNVTNEYLSNLENASTVYMKAKEFSQACG